MVVRFIPSTMTNFRSVQKRFMLIIEKIEVTKSISKTTFTRPMKIPILREKFDEKLRFSVIKL